MFEDFFNIFRVVFATTESEKLKCFLLRHEVYCKELGFEPLDSERRVETDEFDDKSLHCFIEHRATGLTAGCMRVVFPERVGHDNYRLPIEEHFRQHGSGIDMELAPDVDSLCEISRVAIPCHFRSGKDEHGFLDGLGEFVFSQQERRLFPIIGISLFLCATALTGLIQRHHVLAMMESRFQRLLARSGIRFSQVSRSIEFRGERAAFYIDQKDAEKSLRDSIRPLYQGIHADLSRQFLEKSVSSSSVSTQTKCKISS